LHGWTLVSQVPVFTAIDPDTIDKLMRAYARMPTADELYRHYDDLMYGATAVLAVETIESMDAAKKEAEGKKFNAHRKVVGERLVERVNELRPHLEDAIARLRAELPAVRDTDSGHEALAPSAE
jgi:hypothetical protein